VSDLRMNSLGQGTFYGILHVRKEDGQEIEVDSRPSDALALAVRTDCPIFVAEHVFETSADTSS
ncbi:MAG: bifunctional nuclease domain-containing protein, partial [Planctomycetota bacterium]